MHNAFFFFLKTQKRPKVDYTASALLLNFLTHWQLRVQLDVPDACSISISKFKCSSNEVHTGLQPLCNHMEWCHLDSCAF